MNILRSFAICCIALRASASSATYQLDERSSDIGSAGGTVAAVMNPMESKCFAEPCHEQALCTEIGYGQFQCVCSENLVGDGIHTCRERSPMIEAETTSTEQRNLKKAKKQKKKKNKKKKTQKPTGKPTKSPTSSPTDAPVVPPTPVAPPTNAPVVPPTNVPVASPVLSTNAPIEPSVVPPTNAPVVPPTNASVEPPVEPPVVVTTVATTATPPG